MSDQNVSPRAHQTPPERYCPWHEFVTSGECHGMLMRECKHCGMPEHKYEEDRARDWPLPSHPEYPPEDEALVVPRDDNQKENP